VIKFASAAVESLGDLAVAPAFASVRHSRFHKRMRAFVNKRADRLSKADQRRELLALLRAQRHTVFLDGDLFPGPELPPTLSPSDKDSDFADEINDGGDYKERVDLLSYISQACMCASTKL
jgi:hypothetical protein